MAKHKLTRPEWHLIIILFAGTFVAFFNQTTINPALPSIMGDFGVDASTAQWLFSGNTLVTAIMVPINAAIIERWTVKEISITAMSIYAVGCLLTALAPTFGIILVGRVFQGIGSGILMPTGVAALFLIYPEEHRGQAMGVYGLIVGFAPIFGPVVAGIICDVASWHLIYYITAAFSVITVIASIFLLEKINLTEVTNNKLDPLSVTLSTLGFGSLLYGFSEIGSSGLSVVAVVTMLAGVAIIVWFFHRQLHIKNPMLRVDVLRNKKFLVSVLIVMIVQAAVAGNAIIIPILVQYVLGQSATVSGFVMMPCAIVIGVLSPFSGRYFDKHGPRAMSILGLSVLALMTVLLSLLDGSITIIYIIVILCFRSFGMAIVNMPINTWGVNALSQDLIPHGNSVASTFRQAAGSFGTALTVSAFSIVYGFCQDFLPKLDSGIWGINAAFAFQSVLCIGALIIAIIFVKDDKKKKAEKQKVPSLREEKHKESSEEGKVEKIFRIRSKRYAKGDKFSKCVRCAKSEIMF